MSIDNYLLDPVCGLPWHFHREVVNMNSGIRSVSCPIRTQDLMPKTVMVPALGCLDHCVPGGIKDVCNDLIKAEKP